MATATSDQRLYLNSNVYISDKLTVSDSTDAGDRLKVGDNWVLTDSTLTLTQLSGSLTDGTPTDAEIDATTGTTPAGVGAGWQTTIKDSDGTGLLYKVESDGTDWFYIAMIKAL